VAEQADVSPTVRSHWMGCVRKLCLYLAQRVPKTFIPDSGNRLCDQRREREVV